MTSYYIVLHAPVFLGKGFSTIRGNKVAMARGPECLLHHLVILSLLFFAVPSSRAHAESGLKTEVFLSPKIELQPGSVSNKYYYGVDFPKGHIALKSFDAEVVDDKGNPIPLHETYLHHWVVVRYAQRKGVDAPRSHGDLAFQQSDRIRIKNSGICDNGLTQYYGLGSETRKTQTYVPDPYGIEVGNPADIPEGYEEIWLLNVHAIDTRGAENRMGCTECRCDLYNVTIDEYGQEVPSSYGGGLRCCYDETRCKLKDGFQDVKRTLYLRYTVRYLDWDASIVPVGIYILDVTDQFTKADTFRGTKARHHCLVEYNVDSYPSSKANREDSIENRAVTFDFPDGGDVIYGVAHLHAGGTGSALYGEDGREICSSYPLYGKGEEAGNEDGYIVGMTTCYPSPGSVKISPGETLTLVSNYSNAQRHTGVMTLFYLLIANSSAKPNTLLYAPTQAYKSVFTSKIAWTFAFLGVGVIIVVIFMVRGKRGKGEEYEPINA